MGFDTDFEKNANIFFEHESNESNESSFFIGFPFGRRTLFLNRRSRQFFILIAALRSVSLRLQSLNQKNAHGLSRMQRSLLHGFVFVFRFDLYSDFRLILIVPCRTNGILDGFWWEWNCEYYFFDHESHESNESLNLRLSIHSWDSRNSWSIIHMRMFFSNTNRTNLTNLFNLRHDIHSGDYFPLVSGSSTNLVVNWIILNRRSRQFFIGFPFGRRTLFLHSSFFI